MTGHNHLITGACALEHVYVASVLIDRADSAPLTAIQKITQDYLGITDLVQGQEPLYIAILSMALCLMMYFIGTLLPDIDNPNSILGKIFHIPVEHRTWIHAIYLYLVIATLGLFVHPAFSWMFFGVFVHLFWDSFSAMGNCWFYKLFSDYKKYPNNAKVKKGHKLKLYYAGEWTEYLLVFIIIIITVVSFVLINK